MTKITLDHFYEFALEDGRWCPECDHSDCSTQPHGERLCECLAASARDCPGVEDQLAKLIREYDKG